MKLDKDTCIGTINDGDGFETNQYLGEILYPVFRQILENQEKSEKCPHLEIEIQTLQNIVAKHYEENTQLKEQVERLESKLRSYES